MRTSKKDLDGLVNRLNMITGNSFDSYRKVDGKFIPNIGNYFIDEAYGGYKLVQMACESGSTRDLHLTAGHVTKSKLYQALSAFIAGVELKKA